MTKEEEMMLKNLNQKKKYELKCSNYINDKNSYFISKIANVELI